MRKKYENPEMKLLIIDEADIVCASITVEDVLDPTKPPVTEPGVDSGL